MSLPPKFFLHIPTRFSAKDPFSGYILMTAVLGPNNVWKIEQAPAISDTFWIVNKSASDHTYPTYETMCTVAGPEGILLTKRFYKIHVSDPTGTPVSVTSPEGPIPVLEMPKHTTVFGKQRLTRNVPLQWVSAPAPGSPLPTPQSQTSAITHVTTPTPTKPKKPVAPAVGDLHLFVAKQLLEFAQSKHEMCPITAEEYITGQTAAMPCGHLFMRMAIEETFKKEPNKCPACRQLGRPTFV